RARVVVLDELLRRGDAGGLVPGVAVCLGEEPALVAVHGGLDDGQTFEAAGDRAHGARGYPASSERRSCHGVTRSGTVRGMRDHFTLRLHTGVGDRLRGPERRAGLPPRTLAQRYVDEGIRGEDHPLVRFADGPSGRRAALVGSGLDVWETIASVREHENDLSATASYLEIPLGLVEAAVNYYGAYREEIDAQIELNR